VPVHFRPHGQGHQHLNSSKFSVPQQVFGIPVAVQAPATLRAGWEEGDTAAEVVQAALGRLTRCEEAGSLATADEVALALQEVVLAGAVPLTSVAAVGPHSEFSYLLFKENMRCASLRNGVGRRRPPHLHRRSEPVDPHGQAGFVCPGHTCQTNGLLYGRGWLGFLCLHLHMLSV